MFIPVFQIDEHRYCLNIPSTTKLWTSLKSTFSNRNFRIFIVADFSYYMGIAIITNGLLYYVRVLLGLPEAFGGKMIALMVLVSLLFYPVVNWVAGKYGKKMPLVFSFLVMGLAMSTVYYLGEFPLSMKAQAYLLMVAVGLPLAFLSIIPPAILAEIAEIDSMRTGQKREGMFFAVRNFFMKMGQTLGMGCFAVLTLYGKDPGNDMGIRLNGILGLVLGIVAALVFLNFREKGYKRDFSRFLRK
jgi:GPH family glycoside/pentoside/hexuronide:cation symporter